MKSEQKQADPGDALGGVHNIAALSENAAQMWCDLAWWVLAMQATGCSLLIALDIGSRAIGAARDLESLWEILTDALEREKNRGK